MLKAAWTGICSAILLLATAGCSRGPSDAVLTADVQNRLLGDHRVEAKHLSLAASHGVLTLSGTVASEAERSAAAEDASQADGLKVLVNNLQVAESVQVVQAAPAQKPPAAHPVATYAPAHPAQVAEEVRPTVSPEPIPNQPARETAAPNPAAALPTHPTASPVSGVAGMAPSQPVPLPPVPPVEKVLVPAGTVLSVRLLDSVGSEVNDVGDKFTGSLASPVMIGDQVVIPAESGVHGKVVQVQSSGRFSGRSSLVIELNEVSYNGKSYSLRTSQFSKEGASRTTRTAETVGGAAGVGAILGAIVGGGRGAAIGAAIGAGVGTGVQARSKGAEVTLPAETMLSFRLKSPLEVEPSSRLTQPPNTDSDPSADPFPNYRPVLKRRPGSGAADPDTTGPGANQPPDNTNSGSDSPPVLKRRPN